MELRSNFAGGFLETRNCRHVRPSSVHAGFYRACLTCHVLDAPAPRPKNCKCAKREGGASSRQRGFFQGNIGKGYWQHDMLACDLQAMLALDFLTLRSISSTAFQHSNMALVW